MTRNLDHLTYTYKRVGELAIHVDVYPPAKVPGPSTGSTSTKLPAVVYFHGGGLTVGNGKSWFPSWLYKRVAAHGVVFVSTEYQLIPPATGNEILDDIKKLFRFLDETVNRLIQEDWIRESRSGLPFQIDSNALAVAGSSSGGLCAYLAAMHASPRPRAVLSLYGMGGDMLTPQYLSPKTTPFFRGREILEPNEFAEYLYPACKELPAVSDSPLAYHPPTYHIPGYPANPRMLLARLYLQMGTFLDYYTGSHSPSVSASLRAVIYEHTHANERVPPCQNADFKKLPPVIHEAMPASYRHLFPQFGISSTFPPTLLVHGSADTAVLVRESQNLHTLLREAGARVELIVVEGKEHSFDYEPSAEGEFGELGGLFDRALNFLVDVLRSV
ncbi:alpha/beta-hydrolase [Trametes meyenii]|nr:alpha/beta-hydrolase [Trametes meyenii]